MQSQRGLQNSPDCNRFIKSLALQLCHQSWFIFICLTFDTLLQSKEFPNISRNFRKLHISSLFACVYVDNFSHSLKILANGIGAICLFLQACLQVWTISGFQNTIFLEPNKPDILFSRALVYFQAQRCLIALYLFLHHDFDSPFIILMAY